MTIATIMKSCLLQIDQLHHRLQKLKDQPHNSAEIHSISLGVKEDCYERNLNESVLNRNMYLSSSNANDKDIKNVKKKKKNRQQNKKLLNTMVPVINVRTARTLRKWFIMNQATILFSRIKFRTKILIKAAMM